MTTRKWLVIGLLVLLLFMVFAQYFKDSKSLEVKAQQEKPAATADNALQLVSPVELKIGANAPVYVKMRDVVDLSQREYITPSDSTEIDLGKLSEMAKYPNKDLLKLFFQQGLVKRGEDGYKDDAGKRKEWEIPAAIAAFQVTKKVEKVTGLYSQVEELFPLTAEEKAAGRTTSLQAEACRKGLSNIAANPEVQKVHSGIKAEQLEITKDCEIGPFNLSATLFAPGKALSNLANKNWEDPRAMAEAFIVAYTAQAIKADQAETDMGKEISASWIILDNDLKAKKAEEEARKQNESGGGGPGDDGWKPNDPGGDGFYLTMPGKGLHVILAFGYYSATFPVISLRNRVHNGVDLSASSCGPFPVHAVASGNVTSAYKDAGNGGVIYIALDAGGYTNVYVHMWQKTFAVGPGQHVERGQYLGDTAPAIASERGTLAAGCVHLHLMNKVQGVPVNPMDYMKH
jgi:murein DD-endopeptidase MepM/ murein hydrolase activator NlpD